MKNKILLISILILIVTGITGCVYLRFLKVKNQLEDFEKNFLIDDSQGLSLVFKNPVLEEGDIKWLMSADPDRNSDQEDSRILTYILKKRYNRIKNEKENFDIPVKFRINEGRLSRVTLPDRFLKYFSSSLFKSLLGSFGQADIKKFSKEARSRVKESEEYSLPTTKEIVAVLGNPYYRKMDRKKVSFIYRYYINEDGPADRPGVRFNFHFDRKSNKLLEVKSNIKGIDISIDFSESS